MINSLGQVGLTGLHRARMGLQQAANELAGGSTGPIPSAGRPQAVETVVGIHRLEQQARGAVDVIRISDEMLGRLLDILA